MVKPSLRMLLHAVRPNFLCLIAPMYSERIYVTLTLPALVMLGRN